MMHRTLIVTLLALVPCLAMPIIDNSGKQMDALHTNHMFKDATNMDTVSLTNWDSHWQGNDVLDTKMKHDFSEPETREPPQELKAFIGPWKSVNSLDKMESDLPDVILPNDDTWSARERRSNGFLTVNVNCSEHPDLCQQAVAWLQQHDRQVPASLLQWQG